ncbi:hypothetical protein FBY40_2309 [Microbacterium sp. SLBN-154]|uniref:hypothetical protein n=1 Tax=Microbacterium sp. SLBN-154 TaxID=2768458 RepID=UPI001153B254|nr:hypothetical protein [Microbacterium sp. SLBN-154]TQK19796.1 hypothetical protein FBY40_2309 [Microbacterium sp. SLBN-154]
MSVPLASVFDLDHDERHRLLADVALAPTSRAPSRLQRWELRLGLWLLLRAARRQSAARGRSPRRTFAAELARTHREHAAWRALALSTVRL